MERLEAYTRDPERRARLIWWAWLISTGFMMLGFGVILFLLFFAR
jgi:hypothetical protein